jgi:hypothetical protein
VLTKDDLNSAIVRAIKFFDGSREPHALLWLAVMYQRFGVEEFADALQRYDQLLIEQPETAPLLRVLRRFAARDNPLQPDDWDAVTTPSDRILVSALYCDRIGLPSSFPEVLQKVAGAGGYNLPHVILTWVRIRENGCQLALPDGFMEAVYRANVAIIDEDPTSVRDLRIEAAAFLYLAGRGASVNDVFVDSVLAAQNGDGGWGIAKGQTGGSDWHATTLGLLLLLHVSSRTDLARSREARGPGASSP